MPAIPKKLIARDHREAYDLWATHFDDPALMANRDAKTTLRKLENLVRQLPLEQGSRVLDVGPSIGYPGGTETTVLTGVSFLGTPGLKLAAFGAGVLLVLSAVYLASL